MVLAVIVAIAVVLSSAGCLVEEEKPSTKVSVPDDRKDARLVVDGLVGTPLNWTLHQVIDLGLVDFKATFVNSVGTTATSNFTGVRIRSIMERAAACATAELLEVEAADGYKALIFLSDITNDSFIALKEEGGWQNLTDTGAMRFVDTHMGSVYWVKKVVALRLKSSARLELYGHLGFNGAFTAGFLHLNATMDVKWKEGTKNRTARGMSLVDALSVLMPASMEPWYIELIGSDLARMVLNGQDALDGEKDFLAVDSKGKFVYVRDGKVLVSGLTKLGIVNGISIFGNVTKDMNVTQTDLDALPQVWGSIGLGRELGPTLQSVMNLTGLKPGAITVQVGSVDKEPQNISVNELSSYNIVNIGIPTNAFLPEGYYLILVSLGPTGIENRPVTWVMVI